MHVPSEAISRTLLPPAHASAPTRDRHRAHASVLNAKTTVLATGMLVLAGSVLACLGGTTALLFDNFQELAAAGGGALALALASRRYGGAIRRFLIALAGALGGACAGMLAWDLAPAGGGTLTAVGDVLFVLSVCLAAAAIIPTIFSGLGREALAGVAIDTFIVSVAGVAVVGAAWESHGTVLGDRTASFGAVALVAVIGACVMALTTRRIAPARGGPWALVTGAALLGAAWLMWIDDPAAPATVGVSDFLFSGAMLLVASGGVSWEVRRSSSPGYERAAGILMALLPAGAIVASLGVTALADGPAFFDLAGVATVVVIVTAAGRQLYLYAHMTRAREAERQVGSHLATELQERAATLASLQRLLPGPTPEATARQICAEALHLDGIGVAMVRAYPEAGGVVPLAVEGLGRKGAARARRPLDARAAAQVRSRAGRGAWLHVLKDGERGSDAPALRADGVRALVHAPLTRDGVLIGDIGLGTRSPEVAAAFSARLTTAEEFAVVASALLGPALAERDRLAALHRETAAILADRAFYPVFQPIVDLASRALVGYEALTRFDSGQRPDRCFAQAWEAGLGIELEVATLEAALAAAAQLPAGKWLDFNVSPGLLTDPGRLCVLLAATTRPIILEITEHELIGDYRAVREAVRACGDRVRLAVDDAGAGVANFAHIVELRPDFVKLDIGLVRGVDADLGRQALVVAMRHFAARAGCRLVAEGIETEDEARTLVELDVELGQGYLLGRPQPIGGILEPLVA